MYSEDFSFRYSRFDPTFAVLFIMASDRSIDGGIPETITLKTFRGSNLFRINETLARAYCVGSTNF